jgi:uncharacterized protein YpuA (DUF1002 family)
MDKKLTDEELREVKSLLDQSLDYDTPITNLTDEDTIHAWFHQLLSHIEQMEKSEIEFLKVAQIDAEKLQAKAQRLEEALKRIDSDSVLDIYEAKFVAEQALREVRGEMDELVATKVMGWKNPWQPFQPSTDIADAWQVVDKLKEDYNMWLEQEGIYQCMFFKNNPYEQDYSFAKTAPEAICKAALLVMGVEIDG